MADPCAGPGIGPLEPIEIALNGERHRCRAGLSLQELLLELGYQPRLVVVEYNGSILPRQAWPTQAVLESDTVEVVTIVGGGS
jgi:sulfur carrier protein